MPSRDSITQVISQRTATLAANWLPQPPLPVTAGGPDRGWSRAAVRGLVILVALSAAVAGWWWWSGQPRPVVAAPVQVAIGSPLAGDPSANAGPPSGTPTPDAIVSPSPSPPPVAPVVVHVIGQVAHPGLVTLPAGSRVADAVVAAGGVTRPRAASSVNLARPLVDGEQIAVGVTPSSASSTASAASGLTNGSPGSPVGGVLDLNSATAAMLEELPGVGPVLAGRIVQWRTDNGQFRSVEELGEVSGIGDSILSQLRPRVRV